MIAIQNSRRRWCENPFQRWCENPFSHRRWWLLGLAGLLLFPLLGGCKGAIAGEWHLVKAVPNREVFSIDNATFSRDGTFSATTTIEGLTTDEKGTYDFNGWQLKLRPQAGGQRTYSTTRKVDRLEIRDGKRTVVLKKGKKGR
ncbi:MAG: lipocalin family protein [Phycisphaerae bacterium]|nr:lipocalin family protein [Phycisphaerae bacterium]